RETAIRDGVVGLSHGWADLTLDGVTITGHTNAALRVASTAPAFTLDAADRTLASGNAIGLAWDGDPELAQTLTVDGADWTDNGIHVKTDHVESVILRNATLANAETGLLVENGGAVALRDGRFLDNGSPADQGAGADLHAAAVAVSGCDFERGQVGLRVRDASDPDLRTSAFRNCGGAALDLRGGSWNWTATDGLTFAGNHVGVIGDGADWTVDGGAAGVTVVGPGAAAGGRGLIAVGGRARWRRATVNDAAVGFEVLSPLDATLEDCTANGCANYGLYLERAPGQTAPRPVAAFDFTALDCGTGLGYRRGADAAAGVGELELRRLTVARTAAVDSDGYAVGTTGIGLYLDRCPLDPALHTDLAISGCAYGVDVRGRDATVSGAMNLSVERCGTALSVADGAATIADWTNETNRRAVAVAAGTHPVALSNCRLISRDEALALHTAGPAMLTGCTFASRTADALLLVGAPGAPFDAALTDCTVEAAGGDGFHLAADPAFGGTAALLRCTTLDAAGDGLSIAGGVTAICTDCVAAGCQGDGFRTLSGFAAFQGCTAASVGGAGFDLSETDAALEDCTVEGFGTAEVLPGFSLARCAEATVDRCAAAFGPADGLRVHDGGAGPDPDGPFRASVTNFLALGVPCGVRTGAACATTLRHVTVDAADAGLHVAGGTATAVNSVFVGGSHGVRREAGTLTLDHVLLHAPTPAGGVVPGPNDLLTDPRFRDRAAGDLRLAAGSPAINAGRTLSAPVAADLTGAARPSFGRCELGAYEYLEPGGGLRILRWKEHAR
ncbi:right-handed parallel beta-helix repeat-containing protein, partial [Alienimonas sp. DA493]|uniref:right-handed parallel beta-helix repeat-containing protein n=1 Tax=Alienimonas sp. DA493 TaxID=3373605 RepID=UPI003753F702